MSDVHNALAPRIQALQEKLAQLEGRLQASKEQRAAAESALANLGVAPQMGESLLDAALRKIATQQEEIQRQESLLLAAVQELEASVAGLAP